MAKLRFVEDLTGSRAPAGALSNTACSLRAIYETDPEIASALLPRPLVPATRPEVFVQFAHVAMHLSADNTVEVGAATVGIACSYEGVDGYYVLAMPMEREGIVVAGRERFGEPKKIADIGFNLHQGQLTATATRQGVTFLEVRASLGESLGARRFTEYLFCYKALPACEKGQGFDGDPLLVRLEWKRDYTDVKAVTGEIILRESAFDPLIDVPVRRIVRMEYAEGASETGGRVLRSVPGEWLLPFIQQRYDTPAIAAIDVPSSVAGGQHA